MLADCVRTVATVETRGSPEHSFLVKQGKQLYNQVDELTGRLGYTNVVRLRGIQNTAFFYKNIVNDQKTAVRIAQEGFQKALETFDRFPEKETKEIGDILENIRTYLKLWNRSRF